MDSFRRIARTIFRPNSPFYKKVAGLQDFISTLKTDGYPAWRRLNGLHHGNSTNPPLSLKLRNIQHPIWMRPGTADAHTVINNIIRREYDQATFETPPVWMIDAGAYIGDTSAFFLSKYPELKIIALEPGPPSYEMAKRNLEPYGERVILLKKGLYVTDGIALFSGDNTGAAIGTSGFEIDCTTIPTLLEQYSIPRINILKMDIEGAEEALFLSNPEVWLKRVDLLIIEIHGEKLLKLISGILAKNGFTMEQYRSVWYCKSRQ
jgi:FkbM family methyltransferase